MSRFWPFVQACIFSLFLIMATCGFILGYIWRDGLMGPVESQNAVNDLLKSLGPWAVAIDIFVFTPLMWWLARSTFFKPKVKIIPGIIMDDKPIVPIPPVFVPPPYDPTPDYSIWDEMSQR